MRSKLHGLETLRAYAIFSVLLFHYQYFFGHPGWLETGFCKFGWSRSLGLVATLSYSLYLSHKIVFHLVQQWFGGPGVPANGPVMMFLCLGSAVGFALLMHHAIECPAFRLRDWLLAKRSAGKAASLEPPPSLVAP